MIFGVVLALKDLLIKQSLMQGAQVHEAMLAIGCSMLVATFLFLLWERSGVNSLVAYFRLPRLLTNTVAAVAMVMSIQYLDASMVNILNKSTVPLLILFGAASGYSYTRRELGIASFIIATTAAFTAFALYAYSYEGIGYGLFYLALFSLCVEFIYLAGIATKAPVSSMLFTPALGMLIGGAICLVFIQNTSEAGGNSNHYWLSTAAGACLVFAYASSAARYKLLPPGLADTPTIFTFFLIYLGELLLGTKVLAVTELGAALVIMFFSTWLIFARVQSQKVS